MKPSRFGRLLQVGTFLRKEAIDVARQPKLVLTLVAGPFLIMAIFGLGYRDSPAAMRTEFVGPEGSVLLDQVDSYADELGAYVEVVGVGHDEDAAMRRLEDGNVDLVVRFPADPVDSVMAGEHAPITVIHARLDPIERTAISYAARIAVDQINGFVLASIVEGGQQVGAPMIAAAGAVEGASDALSDPELRRLADVLGAGVDEATALATVDPQVMVRPFVSDVKLAVDGPVQIDDWYAPAAVILMLQQFGVAFGALSFVRERQSGVIDVLRVAPVGASETLLGKYLAYLAVGGIIGAILVALVVLALDVPFAAGPLGAVVVIGLTLFASVGLGFVISLASRTDAQAVQYAMTVLLASLFFSGFFLSLGQLGGVATIVGWLLPVTYGMQLLRDVMLRGAPLDLELVAGLSAYGVGMFALALLGTRRRLAGVR